MKVYLATSGEYSDYHIRRVFARKEDADGYELADEVEEWQVTEGPVEVRDWHTFLWSAWIPDREKTPAASANPGWAYSDRRDFDGKPRRVEHLWHTTAYGQQLRVSGWDRQAIMKVYSEQRAQYLAEHADG